jgi:hypothetical protein
MLPLSVLATMLKAKDPGYASVYMFDEDSAKAVIAEHSSTGLSRFPVYTHELVIDLDGGDAQLEIAERVLKERGLAYVLWRSGGKGYHVYIPHTKMLSGRDIPYSQRKYVEGMGIGADLSLYQHGRIISLPGRIHPKTGARKALVKTVKGVQLELPLLVAPEITFNFQGNGGLDDLEAGLWKLLQLIADEPLPGNRHTQLWSTALHLADAGLSHATALELLQKVNEQWQNPKDSLELETAVSQAFRK